jgi:hypothetical protein
VNEAEVAADAVIDVDHEVARGEGAEVSLNHDRSGLIARRPRRIRSNHLDVGLAASACRRWPRSASVR